jgi:hypothetical protein
MRYIESDDPMSEAKRFFEIASKGGHTRELRHANGSRILFASFGKSAFVTLREKTSYHNLPSVQIVTTDGSVVSQQVYFAPLGVFDAR